MRRIHPLTYPLACHDQARPLKLHQRRDLLALIELEAALFELGFRHGEPIFSHPTRIKPPPSGLSEVDLSGIGPDDLILQAMRPPIHDIEAGAKRKIARAYTTLEERHFLCWRRYLEFLARTHVRLAPEIQAQIRAGYEDRREMAFRQKGWGAPYAELNALKGRGWRKYAGNRRSVVFLLRVEHAWEGGPGYLCAFGMDGCTTVVWSYRLARDFRHLLERPGFVMAEIELGLIPDGVTGLGFCMDWRIEPLVVLQEGGASSPARALAAAVPRRKLALTPGP